MIIYFLLNGQSTLTKASHFWFDFDRTTLYGPYFQMLDSSMWPQNRSTMIVEFLWGMSEREMDELRDFIAPNWPREREWGLL